MHYATTFSSTAIKKKPTISSKPGDLQLSEMEPGIFKCKILGYPKPEVTW